MNNIEEKQKAINEICKKNSNWKSLFLNLLDQDNDVDIDIMLESFQIYIKHKHLLKDYITIELLKSLSKGEKDNLAEAFFDEVKDCLLKRKKENFIKSLKTEGYKYLFNEKVEDRINVILDNKISIESMKKQFFNKLFKYKHPKELLKGLVEFQNKNINWNMSHYKEIITSLNVEILEEKEDYLMIEVKDYQACKELGSQAWCIVRSENTFKSYTRDLQRQVIVLDFNLPVENSHSLIGITVNMMGRIKYSYLKNDRSTPNIEKYKFNPLSDDQIKFYLSNLDDNAAFQSVIHMGMDDYIHDYLVHKNVDSSFYDNYALKFAIKNNNLNLVRIIISHDKYKSSYKNNHALKYAIKTNNVDLVKEIISSDKYQPSKSNNEFDIALESKNLKIITLLLKDKGFNKDISANISLARSATKGYLEVVKILMTNDKNDLSYCNHTALRGALHYKHIDVIKFIMSQEGYYQSLDSRLKEEVETLVG
jgi:hypothetical protein